MKDPVIAPDGFTYERTALQTWFAKSNISPVTGAHLANTHIIPNHALRHTIEQYLDKNGKDKVIPKLKKAEKVPKQKLAYEVPQLHFKTDSAVDGDDLFVRCVIEPPLKP